MFEPKAAAAKVVHVLEVYIDSVIQWDHTSRRVLVLWVTLSSLLSRLASYSVILNNFSQYKMPPSDETSHVQKLEHVTPLLRSYHLASFIKTVFQ